MKLPPGILESMTRTLVAFTPKASATELVAMVRVVGYEESVIDSAVEKLSGAAWAWRATPPTRMTSNDTIASTLGLPLMESKAWATFAFFDLCTG